MFCVNVNNEDDRDGPPRESRSTELHMFPSHQVGRRRTVSTGERVLDSWGFLWMTTVAEWRVSNQVKCVI